MIDFLNPPRPWVRAVMARLTRPWLIDVGKELDWVVFEYATGTVFHVEGGAQAKAELEAELAGVGHSAYPFIVAREMANAYNHGRHQERRRHEATDERLAKITALMGPDWIPDRVEELQGHPITGDIIVSPQDMVLLDAIAERTTRVRALLGITETEIAESKARRDRRKS